MRTGKKTLRTGSGKALHFGSARKLENWERVAKAIDHGWKPTKRKRKKT